MATITSNNGKLSLTKKKEEKKSGIVSNNGKLSISKKKEPEKVEDAFFASSTPVLPGPSYSQPLVAPIVSNPKVKNQGNLLSMDVAAQKDKRADVDDQIAALEAEKRTWENEKAIWENSEFRGQKWDEAEKQIRDIQAKIDTLQKSTFSQDVIDEAQSWQQGVEAYRQQKEEEEMLLRTTATQNTEEISALEEQAKVYELQIQQLQRSGVMKGELYEEAQKNYQDTMKQIDELRMGLSQQQIDRAAQLQEMAGLENAVRYVGFENMSKFDTSWFKGAEKVVVDDGYEMYVMDDAERVYRLINKDPEAIKVANANKNAKGVDETYLALATDEEAAIYNYWFLDNKARADKYLELLTPTLLQRQMNPRLEDMAAMAEESPVASSAISVGLTFASLPAYIGQVADYIDDRKIEENAAYNFAPLAQKTIRDTVSEKIEKQLGEKWGKTGSFAYQLGMSMADFLAVSGLTAGLGGAGQASKAAGNIASAILGGNAAAQTTLEAKARGLSDGQALALGTISGVAEWATERWSVEKLLDMSALGKGAGVYMLQNAGTEGSEEGISGLVNLFADVLISRDRSQWQQAIDAYVKKDYDEKSAFAMALSDQVMATGLEVLGGAISGGIMGAGGVALNEAGYAMSRPSGAYQQRQEIMDAIMKMAEEDGGFEIDETEAAGDDLPDGGQGRIPGQSAGEQSGTVRQTLSVFQAGRANDRRSRAQAAGLQPVSGKEQNIPRTTDNRTFSFMPEETWDVEMREVYDNVYKRTGKKVQYIIGQIEIDKGNGVVGYARGVWTTDGRIIVQADHPTLSVRILAEHEKFHSNEFTEDELLQIKQKVIQGHTQESLERVLQNYWTRLKATIGRDAQGNELTMEQAQRKLMDEVFADADAGINEYDAAKFDNVVREESERILAQRNAPKQQVSQATERTTGPPAMTRREARAEQARQAEAQEAAAREAETQAKRTELEQVLEQMSEQLAAGNITEEEFDAVYDEIMSQPEMQDSSFSLDAEEKKSVIADLRTYLSGGMTAQQLNEKIGQRGAQASQREEKSTLSNEAQKIKNAARRQRVSVEEYLHRNWELFDVDGEWNAAAREALDDERGVRFSEETMDIDAGSAYNEENNEEERAKNGREMGNNLRGRLSAQMPGEQSAASAGEYREDQTDVFRKRRGKEPSGQDVLGSDSEGRRLTEEQRRRLRGTKVTDESGAPLALYHGTSEMDFDVFAQGDIGFHFGTEAQAMQRGRQKSKDGRVFRVYLNIKNPYRVRLDMNAWWPSHIGLYLWSEGVISDAQWNEVQSLDGHGYDTPGAIRLRGILDGIGIDGFVYENGVEGTGDSYIALYDDQIVRSEINDAMFSEETDAEYMDAVKSGDMETAQRMVDEAAQAAGYTVRAYHGTGRADRVGNVFLPERATSGPMAFFTSSPDIAANYARDKADTSLAYDEEYADYYSQFRVNKNGKSIKVQDLWKTLPFSEKQRIKEAGKHITLDDGAENIIWDDDATRGLGNWDAYTLNQHKGNAIEALIDCWLDSGELYGNEGDFLKVLELAGIHGVEYRDPDVRHEKVYDTWLKIQTPFNTETANEEFVSGFEEWYGQQPEGEYERESAGADMWDKNNQTAELFAERVRFDIEAGTSHAWTSIPDSVTDYLKSLGYDGIKDTGGKRGGASHTVWIPFSSEQVKSAETVTYDDNGNVIPLSKRFNPEEVDIRFSEETEPVERENLPSKARAYLQSAERAMERGIGRALSVPTMVQRTDLREIVQSITDEYLKTGAVQDETVRNLFETAYRNGKIVDDEFYRDNKDVKDYLRTQAITLSEYDQHDIPDWNDWRKSAFGLLRISNNGLPVDVAYQEVRGMAPGLFPETITAPSDQIQRMREVSASNHRVEKNLDEYYGQEAEEFKRWALNDFASAINEHLSELQQVKRYADERAARQAEITMPETVDEIMQLYTEMKDLRRNRDKVRAKNLLTQEDEMLLGKLHRGEITLEDLPEGSNAKGISKVFEAEREFEQKAKIIREYNNRRKQALRQEADEYLQTANDWKDKKTGLQYARETQERNIRDIVPDEALAQRIIDRYFTPVHEAQAQATKLKNETREMVKKMNLSRKVAKGNLVSEAHAVQLLGEAEDNIRVLENSKGRMKARDGKTLAEWRDVVTRLWTENPGLNEQKVRAAVDEFRKIYDRLFQQMNETRVRNGYEPINYRQGYFPHFQPGDTDGILGAFSKALGIDMQTAALPTSINGLTHTFKPGIQWFGNAQERLGFNTAYDAVEGFDKYIEGVADVIYQTDNLQRLRALAAQIRYRTTDEGIRSQVDQVMEDANLSEEDKKNRIEKIYESGKFTLSNFVVDLEEYTNLLANKKSRADRNMEQALGRGTYQLMKALESRVAANMVAVNPGSWITNLIPLTQGGAQLGKGNLLKGMWQTLKNYKVHDGFEGRSSFLTNRRGSDPLVRTWAQSASDLASRPMEYIDTFVSDSLVRARTMQNIQGGMSEEAAIREADAWAAGVMADRSKGSMPTLFNRSNPITKVFTQFQLEVNNQFSYLFKDLPREQRKKGILALTTALLKFFLGAWLYNEIYEYFIGRRPALDPIGMLNTAVGDFTGYQLPNLVELGQDLIGGEDPDFTTEKQNRYTAVYNLFVASAEELPFIGGVLGGGRVPIQSALPDFQNLGKVIFNEDWSPEKKLATAGKELMAPATYLLPPFGGGQVKKLLQGIKATIEGGRYTVDAQGNKKLQYPVYKQEAVTAAIFGPTATSTGREWIENDFPTLGIHETAAYDALRETGMSEQQAYELVQDVRAAEKTGELSEAKVERQVLRNAEATDEEKGIVYYSMLASDKEIALMDLLAETNEDLGTVYQMLDTVKDAENSNVKRQAILDANLTEDEKIAAYRYLMGTKQEDGSYLSSRDDDIEAFRAAGMSFDDFLMAQNQYTEINETVTGAGNKATDFSWWADHQNWTNAQKQVAKEAFSYYSNVPASAGNYDKLTGAGLDQQTAYDLADAFKALEPMEGKSQVSDVQKYKAIADAHLSDEDTLAAFGTIMGEKEMQKVQAGYDMAVSPRVYANVKYTLSQFDADGSGSYNQQEIEEAIDAYASSNPLMRLNNGDKAILWQMLTGSTSAKNNPYSRNVAQDYLDRMQEE